MENDDIIDEEDSDIDTEEIKGQLKTMQDALQRHFGHHKVIKRARTTLGALTVSWVILFFQICTRSLG